MSYNDSDVMDAQVAIPILPPRPDAIMTLLTSDDFLPGAQTLLYSIKVSAVRRCFVYRYVCVCVSVCHERLCSHVPTILGFPRQKQRSETSKKDATTGSSTSLYPPEIVVLVSPNVSKAAQSILHPALCTRILTVEPIGMPINAMDSKVMSASTTTTTTTATASLPNNLRHYDNHCPGLTKLSLFQLTQYDTILYIDSDCLVVQDVSHLIDLGKVYIESEALIAAAPDIFPPDKFNSGVMVVRPNQHVFDNMMGQRTLLTTSDGSDTGFLNAYFSEWFTAMPPQARLSFGYNAQQVLHDMTTNSENGGEENHLAMSNYWDMVVGPNLYIVHYSSSRKPWEAKRKIENKDTAAPTTSTTSSDLHLHHAPHRTDLEDLWQTWHQKSKNYLTRFKKEWHQEQQAKEQALVRHQQQQQRQQQQQQTSAVQAANDPKVIARLIRKRFKELRGSGMSVKDAMQQARLELRPEQDARDAGSQVASMFGL
jgi:alpha-N-acetylglucosamine transferase